MCSSLTARNSCHRNHRRYTLCAFHHGEGHPGDWQTCPKCRKSFPTEIYVRYGTNEYNFVKLENPPASRADALRRLRRGHQIERRRLLGRAERHLLRQMHAEGVSVVRTGLTTGRVSTAWRSGKAIVGGKAKG